MLKICSFLTDPLVTQACFYSGPVLVLDAHCRRGSQEKDKKKSLDGDDRLTARAAMECGNWHHVKETEQ
jgi:hypothetical protein